MKETGARIKDEKAKERDRIKERGGKTQEESDRKERDRRKETGRKRAVIPECMIGLYSLSWHTSLPPSNQIIRKEGKISLARPPLFYSF